METRSKYAGLTLMETLLVIAVAGILIAVLVPAILSGIQGVNQAKCVANLRELWKAQQSYQTDNNGNFLLYQDAEGWAWTARLMENNNYLPAGTSVFYCPAFSKNTDLHTPEDVATRTGGLGYRGKGVYSHYGYNHSHLGSSQRYGGNLLQPAKYSQIQTPSRTVVFVDSIHTRNAEVPRGSYVTVDRADSQHMPEPRHQGAANAVFVDGHVESIRLKDPANPFLPFPDGFGTAIQEGSLWKR